MPAHCRAFSVRALFSRPARAHSTGMSFEFIATGVPTARLGTSWKASTAVADLAVAECNAARRLALQSDGGPKDAGGFVKCTVRTGFVRRR